MSQQSDENKIFDQKCRSLIDEIGVRFTGVINNMGRQVAGGYKETITPLVDEEKHKISLESLGSIDSIITRRKKVTMITIPMGEFSLLISAERDSNAEEIVEKASKLFNIK
jgi:hypothetical protein